MTYCLAIKVQQGLVFCSDSRTNAGPDQVNTYSKMHRFSLQEDRQMVLLSAGNLATSQAVVAQLHRDLDDPEAETNLNTTRYVSDAADYVGRLSLNEQNKYANGGPNAGFNAEATFILGGQIRGSEPELYLIYPEGNHITVSEQHPFLQIGEAKYGKPILDRIVRPDTDHETAMRCALVSIDSTMRSNATVGPPIECLFYAADSFSEFSRYISLPENHPYLVQLRESWDERIREAFQGLPSLSSLFEDEQLPGLQMPAFQPPAS